MKFDGSNIKYKLFANATYAMNGLKEVFINEKSLKVEILVIVCLWVFIAIINIDLHHKLILAISLMLPILVEYINSAIERCVDLVTTDYNEMAKKAKDAGSASVFISIVIVSSIWISIFISM